MKKKIIIGIIIGIVILISLNSASAATNVTDCGILTTENEIYTLNTSLTSLFDCVIINATNITLDCQGYNITYGNASGGWGIGVVDEGTQLGFNNVTIKNCVVIQNQSAINESAVFFGGGSENGLAYNNTIITYGEKAKGFMFEESSINANISSNTITTSGINAIAIFLGESGTGANISNNIVTTSGNDSSGIKMGDESSGLVYNNTVITSGNGSSADAMGGIWLESNTVNINVSSNNVTMSGYDNAGIWIWSCSNHSIENNNITTSGESSDGVYLTDVRGINLSFNTIDISGESGDGIHSTSSTYPLLFHYNIITTSGTYSNGITLDQDSNNNISLNGIITSGGYSYGLFSNQSHNNTMTNNIIATGATTAYVLYFDTTSNDTIYNNIFGTFMNGSGVNIENSDLNYFNTTETIATNIIGGPNIGGNYWTNNAGMGFSENCADFNGDYLCDSAYTVIEGMDHIDSLPLTRRSNMISACEALNFTGRIYYLNQSVAAVNGTCINIAANNVTLNFSSYSISGNTTGYGVNVSGYNGTTIIGGKFSNFSNGIYLSSGSNNTFSDIIINNSQNDAILLNGATSDNNTFTSVTVLNTNSSFHDINFSTEGINGTWIIDTYVSSYAFTGSGGLVNFKISGLAAIEFLTPINGSGTNLTLSDVNLATNLLFTNSSSNIGLNKSANITFYGITYTDPKPQYSSNGAAFVDCTATTNPACSEIGFSGNAFKFNTTHFTYFRSAEAYSGSSLSSGSSGGTAPYWIKTYDITDEQFKQGYTQELEARYRIQFNISNEEHYIGVINLTNTTATINVSSSPQQAVFLIGDERRFDVTGDDYFDIAATLNGIADSKANITILSISEKVTEAGEEAAEKESEKLPEKLEENLIWLWIIIAIILILILSGIGYKKKRRRK